MTRQAVYFVYLVFFVVSTQSTDVILVNELPEGVSDVDQALAVMNLQRTVVSVFVQLPVRMVRDLRKGIETGYDQVVGIEANYEDGRDFENFELPTAGQHLQKLLQQRVENLGNDMTIVYYDVSFETGGYFGIAKVPNNDDFDCFFDCSMCNSTNRPYYSWPSDCETTEINFNPSSMPSWAPFEYDPRVRPFYMTAKSAGQIAWVDPYVYVSLGGLIGTGVVSPFFFPNGTMWGVIDCEYTLEFISSFLRQNSLGIDVAFIVGSRDGKLVATSKGRLQDVVGGVNQQLLAQESDDRSVRMAAESFELKYGNNITEIFSNSSALSYWYQDNTTQRYAQVIIQRIQDEHGLDWTFFVSMPQLCVQAQFFNETSYRCEPCPRGTYSSTASSLTACIPCDPGWFADTEGNNICSKCGKNSYTSQTGAFECDDCPENTFSEEGMPTILDCHCIKAVTAFDPVTSTTEVVSNGFYVPSGLPGQACLPCPNGGVCMGLEAPPFSLPAFWNSPGTTDNFYSCPGGLDACPGNGTCSRSYVSDSVVCSECESGFFKFSNNCLECELPTTFRYLLFCVLLLWFPVQKYLATKVSKAFYVWYPYLQTLAIISTLDLSWPDSIRNPMTVFSFVNFNLEVTEVECSGWGDRTYWTVYMTLPLMYMAWFLLRLAISAIYKYLKGTFEQKAIKKKIYSIFGTWMFFLNSLYIMLFGKSIDMLYCQDFGGGRRVVKTLKSITCDDRNGSLGLAYLGILFCGAGIPIFIAALLYYLRDFVPYGRVIPDHLKPLSFIWKRFEAEYYWWELIVILRKMSIVLIAKLEPVGILQAIYALLIVYIFGLCQFYARPFNDTKHDYLDSVLFMCQFVILLIGVLFTMDGLNQTSLKTGFHFTFTCSLIVSGVLSCVEAYAYSKYKVRKESKRAQNMFKGASQKNVL